MVLVIFPVAGFFPQFAVHDLGRVHFDITARALATADPAELEVVIHKSGFFRMKAKHLLGMARALVERHGGEVPRTMEELVALPGVARKTANVVLSIAFAQDTMAVDTHVFRLGNRTGIAPGRTVRAVEDALMQRVPRELIRVAHHWLILHGRRVCKARRPECWRCPAAQWCRYPDKTPAPG